MGAMNADPILPSLTLFEHYKMRLRRRRLLWRSWRSRRQLTMRGDRTKNIGVTDILAVVVLRNEAQRLSFFLAHYRRLGVSHFLIVDNDSNDGSAEMLADQPDVSLWHTTKSYHASRFGVDWSTYLQWKYARAHWCLTIDVDEVLIYSDYRQYGLHDLTTWLDNRGAKAFGALLLDLYPKGPLSAASYKSGQDPSEVLNWFDPGPYRAQWQKPMGNLWVQGGVRERVFFGDDPRRSPTLNKLPLVKWYHRYAYANSSHSILPPELNLAYDGPGGKRPSGVLLHSKFLPQIVSRSATEKSRAQHFHTPSEFDHYYDGITADPDLWHPHSVAFEGPEQLRKLGLMKGINWE